MVRETKTILIFSLLLLGICSVSNVYALGQLYEENWHGVSSYADGSDTDGTYIDDGTYLRPALDASLSSEVLNGAAWSSVSPYNIHGYVDSSIMNGGGSSSGAIFDELFFSVDNGEAASFTFNFDLDFTVKVVDTEKALTASWGQPSTILIQFFGDHHILDTKTFNFISDNLPGEIKYFVEIYSDNDEAPNQVIEMEDGMFSYSDALTLATNGWLADTQGIIGLVDSGTYLPFTISLIAWSEDNLIIDYSNSFIIDENNPYNAYNAAGNLLDPASYRLSSPENFTQQATAPVPEPSTVLLLGSGLLGLGWYGRKRGKA